MPDIRVTVIDDDQDVLDTFIELLEFYGYDAVAFNKPVSRIEEIIRTHPDLILVDLRLDPHREQLTGLQTIHAARTSMPLRQVPIIVCSADTTALAQAWPELMARGNIHQLEKPFDLVTFERVIAMALGHAPQPGTRLTDVGMSDAAPADHEAISDG